MKCATKPIQHYPPRLRHVATLPWEIKNSIFCRYSADVEENANKLHFNFFQLCYSSTNFDIFGVFPILIANKIFHVTFLLIVYFCDQFLAPEFVTADVTAMLSTIKMVVSNEDKIFIRSLYLKGYTAKKLTDEFQSWVIS